MKKKKKRARASGRRGISRIDQPSTRTHGWFVRIGYHQRKDGSYGPRYTKYFGDASHGGKQKALAAAEKYHRAMSKNVKGSRRTKKR
jgi:hypothetical protein